MSSTRGNESSQGDGGAPPPPPMSSAPAPAPAPAAAPPEHSFSRAENKVFKSGPLFLSSKGIGWTSWKKRWFILTRTSLVFFRSDPNAVPQKGSEVNLILGGIDLNNSGSVVVKADKKLLTVLFPDGRDGRAFTLKAETMDDLYEWKAALESALAEAPSAALVKGQNGILKSDQTDGSEEQSKEKQSSLSMVIGRPVLLALEEVDGSPSFLEKALRFVEEHGIKVEGILRQAAAVDDVEHRIREYEQGKNEFSPHEDAHVIADCIKFVLRELPSSPVPASCCNALLEACRTNHENRVQAMRTAICETFPEPNRRLLQRILLMMQAIASHKAENRMSSSAVAACMAPLLLRPLLAGDCELENDFDLGGDGSAQLLQAAAAANHAQAIVITLLEEYDNIFGEATLSPDLYSEAEDSRSESEEATDDDESYEDDEREYSQDSEMETDETESISSESHSGSSDIGPCDESVSDEPSIHSPSAEVIVDSMEKEKPSSSAPEELLSQSDRSGKNDNAADNKSDSSQEQKNDFSEVSADHSAETNWVQEPFDHSWSSSMKKSTTIATRTVRSARRPAWGRTPGKKNLSMENIDIGIDDEDEIQRLEVTRNDLQDKLSLEAKKNAVLQGKLEREKKALHERRLGLQQEVARLQEQLQKERDLRRALEAGLAAPQVPLPIPVSVDEKVSKTGSRASGAEYGLILLETFLKTKKNLEELALARADISNLKQKVDDLGVQLNKQREENNHPLDDLGNQQQKSEDNHLNLVNQQSDDRSTANLHIAERSTSSKDSKLEVTETTSERNQESTSSLSKTQSSSHHLDSLNSKSRCSGLPPADPVSGRHNALSKRSTSRGEGTNTTASALTKLTTRLNFLKERRTQIANELQHMDKSGSSGQVLEKGKTSEVQSLQSKRRGTESDSGKPAQSYDDQTVPEDDSKNPDTLRKSDSQHVGRGKKSDGRTSPNLDRAR